MLGRDIHFAQYFWRINSVYISISVCFEIGWNVEQCRLFPEQEYPFTQVNLSHAGPKFRSGRLSNRVVKRRQLENGVGGLEKVKVKLLYTQGRHIHSLIVIYTAHANVDAKRFAPLTRTDLEPLCETKVIERYQTCLRTEKALHTC